MESVDRPVSFENNIKPGRDAMNKKGFTLIELLIVVVIIGILAAIAIPRFGETRERAYVSAMQSDLNQLRTAMEMYYQDDNRFTYVGATPAALGFAADGGYSDGVIIALGTLTATEWAATTTHTATTRSCSYDSDEGIIDCSTAGPTE